MNHYIVTFTKVHHKITQEQRDTIIKSNATEYEVNGQFVKLSNIADILDEQKYFETYPDKLPAPVRNDFEENYGYISQQIHQPTANASRLIKEGFIGYLLGEKGLTLEEAEEKWKSFIKSGAVLKSF